MAYSFYGKDSRTFIKKNSTASRILEFIKLNGGISIGHCKSLGNKNTFECSLWSLYRRDYVKRFSFSTREGFIYYTDAGKGFLYGLDRSLIPLSVRILYEKIEKNGAISSLELRDIGISQQEINWFYHKLVKAKIIKSSCFERFLIFYSSDEKLERYIKEYGDHLKSLVSSYAEKVKRKGLELERIIADYYRHLGFDVETNKFFTDSYGDKIEIDVLASRPELHLTIAVECKNYESTCLGSSIFLKIAKIKNVMPRALIHIYAKHISDKLIKNRGFWNQYRDVWLFSTKQVHEIVSLSSDKEPLQR